jgi:4-hydroxy-L-threonine phosphate dehydrogenase PdxA
MSRIAGKMSKTSDFSVAGERRGILDSVAAKDTLISVALIRVTLRSKHVSLRKVGQRLTKVSLVDLAHRRDLPSYRDTDVLNRF